MHTELWLENEKGTYNWGTQCVYERKIFKMYLQK
jgi:hypothetical protein